METHILWDNIFIHFISQFGLYNYFGKCGAKEKKNKENPIIFGFIRCVKLFFDCKEENIKNGNSFLRGGKIS